MTQVPIELASTEASKASGEALSFRNAQGDGPPTGFPSDLELTRLANQLFAQCNESGMSPFENKMESDGFPQLGSAGLSKVSQNFLPSTNTPIADIDSADARLRSGHSNLAEPRFASEKTLQSRDPISLTTPHTFSPFAFLDHHGAASFSHPAPHSFPNEGGSLEQADLKSDQVPNSKVNCYQESLSLVGRVTEPSIGALDPRGFSPTLVAAKVPETSSTGIHPHSIREDFPILAEVVHGKPLIWLDNAATTQKPQSVIDRLSQFYLHENSNIHRAAHELARRSTDAYEAARDAIAKFINASSSNEIVFVRGTTEAINLVAQTFGRQNIGEGDEVIVTYLEHHANIVPWQQLCAEKNAKLLVAPVDDSGQILLDEYAKLISNRTKIVSLSQVSNALGTITPAREMVEIAHRNHVPVLVDGAQSVSHMPVDVQSLDCDFFVFSGHKIYGPTGIGALYGKENLLNGMPPWQGGGNMIQDVAFERTVYQAAPMRFEAGTGNIADAVGLHAAIDYVQKIGLEKIGQYENELLAYGTEALSKIPGLRMIGTAAQKAGVLSFVVDGVETESIGKALSREGIAVRSGHHCAQPILRRFGLESTVRASVGLYNTMAELDRLADVVRQSVR